MQEEKEYLICLIKIFVIIIMVELTKQQKLKLFTYLCKVYGMRNGKRILVSTKKKGGCGCGR